MQNISNNDLLEYATLDVDGKDLLKHISNKFKNWHPTKCIEFLDELFKDKDYNKLVAALITIKLQRIRSNLLKQLDTLMTDGDVDIIKSLDKLLQVVIRFSKVDDEDDASNRIIIRYPDDKEEKFKRPVS